jgi:hypothetical protein
MRDADLVPAVEVIRAGNWGDRRESLAFFLTHPRSYPFVAESDGAIVGTSVATHNGNVGWVGLVFVAPALSPYSTRACGRYRTPISPPSTHSTRGSRLKIARTSSRQHPRAGCWTTERRSEALRCGRHGAPDQS